MKFKSDITLKQKKKWLSDLLQTVWEFGIKAKEEPFISCQYKIIDFDFSERNDLLEKLTEYNIDMLVSNKTTDDEIFMAFDFFFETGNPKKHNWQAYVYGLEDLSLKYYKIEKKKEENVYIHLGIIEGHASLFDLCFNSIKNFEKHLIEYKLEKL